jgi:predicted lipoprotein
MKKDLFKSICGLAILLVLLIGYAILFSACGGGGGGSTTPTVTVDPNQTSFLNSVSSKVLLPTIEDFVAKTNSLHEKLVALEGEIVTNGGSGGTFLTEAQTAWEDAMLVWQSIEMMQFGPVGTASATLGGKGLRDEIYSWPTTSPCAIDQEIVKNNFKTADYLDSKLINIYGLDALEYLLFHQDLENTCSSLVDINANGTWSALSESEIQTRRAGFAVVISNKLAVDATQILNEWEATGSNFVAKFNNAGTDKTVYATSAKALNAVYDALFYIESKVKDKKLALPFSLGSSSGNALNADNLELSYSRLSRKSLVANLKAFRLIFQGGASATEYGLDDLLIANNASATATEILQKLNIAIATFEGLSEFEDIIASGDTAEIEAAYEDLRVVTTLIKEDLAVALSLQIPIEGAGDND